MGKPRWAAPSPIGSTWRRSDGRVGRRGGTRFRHRPVACRTCGEELRDGDVVLDHGGLALDHARCAESASLPGIGSPYRLLAPPSSLPVRKDRPVPTDGIEYRSGERRRFPWFRMSFGVSLCASAFFVPEPVRFVLATFGGTVFGLFVVALLDWLE